MKTRFSNTLLAVALAAFALAPAMSMAGGKHDKDKGKDKNRGKSGWSQKAPKSRTTIRIDDRYRSSDRYRNDDRNRVSAWQLEREAERRRQTKNEWRNIAYVSGAVAVLGLLTKDKTLVFAGSAGALYSYYRYEQDRKSQNSLNRARAAYFGRPYFVRDGVRYNRRTVVKNGQKYYQFCRA